MAALVHNTSWIPAHFHLTVAGPVFLAILGMTLFLTAGLLGKPVVTPKVAVAIPYVWTIGVFTFSAGLFYGGLKGVPRRTNLGMSFLAPDSESFRPDWVIGERVGAVGGCIMGLAVVLFLYALARTLLAARSPAAADSFALPQAVALHDEPAPGVRNFRPWVIAGVVAILISYVPPLIQVLGGDYRVVTG
jgi:cytochrome c oxidase subunit 1